MAGLSAALVAAAVHGFTPLEPATKSHLVRYTPEMRRALTPHAPDEYVAQMARSRAQEGTPQDCAMRRLTVEMAAKLQPLLGSRAIFDALQLEQFCGDSPPPFTQAPLPAFEVPSARSTLFVAATGGDDSNAGTRASPLASVHFAVSKIRALPAPRTVMLLGGVHFIGRTLNLTHADANLTLMNAPGEDAWLSGGKALPVDLEWKRVADMAGNVWRAQLPADFGPVPALHALMRDGTTVEQPRARHPNKRPEDGTMEHSLWSPPGVVWTKPTPWAKPARTVWLASPNDTVHHAGECGSHFTYGVGGPCERYTPAGGYLCSANATGGGYGWETEVPGAPLFPVGINVPSGAWSDAGVPAPSQWASEAESGTAPVLETWTNGWATTFWEVGGVSGDELHFRSGGQQIGRGFHTPNNDPTQPLNDAGPWKIENALELLDAPEEWFYAPKSRTLTLHHNASGSPADGNVSFVVPQLKQLVRVIGSQAQPVVGVSLKGLGVRDAAPTYLDAWGVPSGGDWALHRGGAVFVEGAEGFAAEQCRFAHLGTNALFLSGYNQDAAITNSSFRFLGESAVALWGDTRDVSGAPASRLPDGVGIDGDGGAQPRGTRFAGNVVSDIGLTERQSSAFGEFKACQSIVEGNIVYNIPRAAININDGFGGGTMINRNLLFNTCRESGDHGPFNSWDRIPFLVNGSLVPKHNVISNNLIFSNYGAGFGVDNDDTSSYYTIRSNVFYGGGGVKCDYDGHDKFFVSNVMVAQAGGAACHHTCAYRKPFTDHCVDNTIVQASRRGADLGQQTDPYAIIWFCNADDPSKINPDYDNSMLPEIHSNRIYNSNGTGANVTCGYSGPTEATLVPLTRFMEVGLMRNTTVSPLPTDEELVGWCRDALQW